MVNISRITKFGDRSTRQRLSKYTAWISAIAIAGWSTPNTLIGVGGLNNPTPVFGWSVLQIVLIVFLVLGGFWIRENLL